jgi:hypothetical protein
VWRVTFFLLFSCDLFCSSLLATMTDGHLFNNITLGGRGGTVSSLYLSLRSSIFYLLTFRCYFPKPSFPPSFFKTLIAPTALSIFYKLFISSLFKIINLTLRVFFSILFFFHLFIVKL